MSRRRPAERMAGGLLSLVVAVWMALVEVFWLPLRVGGVVLPVSVVAAVVANLLLPQLALRLSGSRLVAALTGVAWLVVVVAAMIRRPEGDLIITGGGATGVVNLAFLLLGVLAAAFAVEDDEVAAAVDGRAHVALKDAAMRAYPTQIMVDGPFFALSNNLGQEVLGTEYYRLVRGERGPAGGGPHGWEDDLFAGVDDLFAGVNAGEAVRV